MAPSTICDACFQETLDNHPRPWSMDGDRVIDAAGEEVHLSTAVFSGHPMLAWRLLYDPHGLVFDINVAFPEE